MFKNNKTVLTMNTNNKFSLGWQRLAQLQENTEPILNLKAKKFLYKDKMGFLKGTEVFFK